MKHHYIARIPKPVRKGFIYLCSLAGFFQIVFTLIAFQPAGTAFGQVFRGYSATGSLEYKSREDNDRQTIKGYFPGGTLQFIAQYKDDKLNGTFKEYYANGFLKASLNFINNKRSGLCRFYYPNGMLMAKADFMGDSISGGLRLYDESGHALRPEQKANGEEVVRAMLGSGDSLIIWQQEKKGK